jgi:hypothetical protein
VVFVPTSCNPFFQLLGCGQLGAKKKKRKKEEKINIMGKEGILMLFELRFKIIYPLIYFNNYLTRSTGSLVIDVLDCVGNDDRRRQSSQPKATSAAPLQC